MWPFGEKRHTTDENGEIVVHYGPFGPNVMVGGYSQTGEGLNAIFHDALARVSLSEDPQLLVIGLGGGGILRELYASYPTCTITAIEHDAAMVDITHELKYFDPHPAPRIILADAREALGNLDQRFDLIVIDIFRGGEPSPHLRDGGFIDAVKTHLAPGGLVLVNVAGARDFLEDFAHAFPRADMWRCEENYLGLFGD